MKTIRAKMLAVFGGAVLILFAFLIIRTSNSVSESTMSIAVDMCQDIATARSDEIGRLLEGYLRETRLVSSGEALQSDDEEAYKAYMSSKASAMNSAFRQMAFCAASGTNYNTKGGTGSVGDREYFTSIMNGGKEEVAGELLISKNSGDKSFIMASAVKDANGKKIGVLTASTKLETISNITNQIKVRDTGFCWVFQRDGKVVAHTDPEFTYYKNVLEDADTDGYTGLTALAQSAISSGKAYGSYYSATLGCKCFLFIQSITAAPNWFFAVSVPETEITSLASATAKVVTTTSVIAAVVLLAVIFFAVNYIAQPIAALSKNLEVIGHADFTQPIPEQYLKRNDEIGLIAQATNNMQTSIKGLLQTVSNETVSLVDAMDKMQANMVELRAEISDVNEHSEMIASSMEEVTSSTIEMGTTSQDILSFVNEIMDKVKEGLDSTSGIREKADELKANALKTQTDANVERQKITEEFDVAIDKSKSVEQVSELTGAILKIASQTNLLALNASIEAARAGEMGRGFSVVATEIGDLADNSSKTATNIQQIVVQAVDAVSDLKGSTEKIMTFTDDVLAKDYESITKIGDDYVNDASFIAGMMSSFDETCSALVTKIDGISQSIREVSKANESSAQETVSISQKTGSVRDKADATYSFAEESRQDVQRLSEIVGQFRF